MVHPFTEYHLVIMGYHPSGSSPFEASVAQVVNAALDTHIIVEAMDIG